MSSEVLSARARLAVNTRHHPNADRTKDRRDLAAAKIAAYVEKIVAEAPPLTSDQADKIAALLTKPSGGDAR